MFILLTMQFIYTLLCVYFLMKKLDTRVSTTRIVIYAVFSFTILTGAFVLPLVLNYYDSLTRGFILYLGLYFITMALLFPDELIKDKERTTTMKLSNYILYYYVIVYVPIVALNASNTLDGFMIIGKTLLIVISVLILVIGLRYLERRIRDTQNERTISIIAVLAVLGGIVLFTNQVGKVNLAAYETRATNEVLFDDESYIAEEFSFEVSGVGTEIFDFAIDDEYLYLLTSSSIVDTLYVSIIDKDELTTLKTYEYYPNNDKYTWFIHLEQDFIFNQDGIIYFTFIDGIYTIDTSESTKISDIGDQDSYKFLYNDEFHLASKVNDDIIIYEFTETGLQVLNTIPDTEEGIELNSINNYLTMKDKTESTISVYPKTTYSIPSNMLEYPIVTVNADEIILSNDLNPLVVEFGGVDAKFDYYFIRKDGTSEQILVDDYMFELQQYSFEETTVLYEVFPEPTLYNPEFVDVTIPELFIHDVFGTSDYSLKNVLVQKNDSLYGIYYKISDFNTNQIYIEINEVKELIKTYDLGFFTDFSKEAFLATALITLACAGNFTLKKKDDGIPKHR